MGRLSLLAVVAIAMAICITSGSISAKKCGNKATGAVHKAGLEAHNNYRAKHKDTPPLTLDDELNKAAQACAQMLVDTGKKGHVCGHKEAGHGENLASGSGYEIDPPEKLMTHAVDRWYGEIAKYNWASPDSVKGVGHFTQVVWNDTTKVGFGVAVKGDSWVVAARYSPPGNYHGANGNHVKPLK